MKQDTDSRITAQDFYDYEKCPHRIYLNHHGDPSERLELSEFLNLLFGNALTHESLVVKELTYESPNGVSLEERHAETLSLMERGAQRIYHGVLLGQNESGIPDLLEKEDGRSRFGDFHYKPVDIKAGSGYKDSTKQTLRTDYGTQLYHYGKLLQGTQETFPAKGEILNRQKERVVYPLSQFTTIYDQRLQEIRALVSGAQCDEPALCGDCSNCQWQRHCEKILLLNDDVTLLPDVGRSKKAALKELGVNSIKDLNSFDFSFVKVKGLGPGTLDSMKRSAAAVLSKTMRVISKPLLPHTSRKLYLDFEDDPTQELIYLCGLWIDPPLRGLNYHGFFCVDEAGEANIWGELQDLCAEIETEDFTVFHFSPYEKAKLATLERKYGLRKKSALEKFRQRMIDLYRITKESVVLPARGYGLKKIAPFVGLKYSATNAGGAQSIVWFQQYQRDPSDAKVMQILLTYNQEDCVNMKYLEHWLRRL